nr:PREDICTED: protein FAM178A [Struthio camelus australis]
MLYSSDRGNVKDGGIGLSALCAERFEKKVSSPKQIRRKKMPVQTPNISPGLDAFRRGVKGKKDSVNLLENSRACRALSSVYPQVVIQKLLVTAGSPSCLLAKKDKTVKQEQGRNEKCPGVTRTPLSCGNSWEQKTDCMDLEEASSDSDKWVSSSEADTRKTCARNNGNVSNTSLCQNPGRSVKLPCAPSDSQFRRSLEALCRERKQKKHRMKQSKPHPVKPFSGASLSHQGNGCPLRKRSHSASWETASDDPSQSKHISKPEASSPNLLRLSSEKATVMRKSQSFPSLCLSSKMSSGPSKRKDFSGKRKRTAVSSDANSSNPSVITSLNDPRFSRSSEQCGNRKSDFVKKSLFKSPCNGIVQLMDAAALPRHDSVLSEEYLDSSRENEKNNSSSMGLSSSYSAHSPNKNNHVSVVDAKENQLQVTHSHFFLEKSLPLSQEKRTVLPSLHQTNTVFTKDVKSHLQNAGLSQVLDAMKQQDGKRLERPALDEADSTELSKSLPKTKGKALENTFSFHSVEGSGKLALSKETSKTTPHSLPFKEGCVESGQMSSQLSGEVKVEITCIETSKLNSNSKSSIDSEDESLECDLDDDDDEEIFLPLQEILSSSPQPQVGTVEGDCLENLSQDTMNPSLKLPFSKPPVVSQVSYVNSLEHLLKEKEESKRVDELEKQLQEDIQGAETNSSDGEDEDANADWEISEEHRAFIQRFSITAHAIPDYHPGEDIFDLATSGKIFKQHNLDLRNFYFVPQNPIEKLLLSSGATQQLSLAIHGFLSSAYSCILCPIPILKWLFQMMSVHPDYCVSTQILDKLIEITLKNASISDEQSKPWIPSLADVSAVFVNMGVAFRSLFPLQHLQPNFNECDILSHMQETVSKKQLRGDLITAGPAFSTLPETNLINVIKFLGFCTTVYQGGYTDQEILLLLLSLFKISLEKQLKQIPLIDFQCLFIKLLKSIKDWDTKMPELCLAMSELSSQHHNLLWLVQLVPSWIIRGRQVRRRLSLVIISKFLNKKHIRIPDTSDEQMSLLRQYLVHMKPSSLLKRTREGLEQQNDVSGERLHTELEQQTYYLIYILLHLVSEASFFDVVNSNQRQHLLKLCGALDKHIKCDIREDARLFYRTKVKDLVARIYGKWQDMIQNTRPTQGKLHDFWEPDL